MPPSFRYLIGGAEQPVVPGSPLWESPLPMDRHHFRHGTGEGSAHEGFTHGDYFSAARRFFKEYDSSTLSDAPGEKLRQNPSDIDICLMKHGECYHPAKITMTVGEHRRTFVLNVAVSDPGCRIIDTEIAALERLGGVGDSSFVPRIYGRGDVAMNGERTVRMFLGEWFDGYHEFHISERGPRGLSVWGEEDIPSSLSTEAAQLLYHQAAGILTRYYNPATTEHVSGWHHAAGDFVVRCRENRVDVRLITVRQYGPMLKMDEVSAGSAQQREQALAALLLFLIGLSIRMRLDRLEGIGEMAWADDTAVTGTWTGFLEGLSENYFPTPLLPDPIAQFKEHLASYRPEDLYDLAETMSAALPLGPAEKVLVEKHLDSHVDSIIDTIRRIGFP